MGSSRSDETGFVGGDDKLGPVADGQLGQQVADVGAGGGEADVQLLGDSWYRRPWPRCGSRYSGMTVSRRSLAARQSSSSAGRQTTAGPAGYGQVAEMETPLAVPLARLLTTPDTWRTFAEPYLEAAGRADPKRPRTVYETFDETSYRRKERADDLATWHEMLQHNGLG